MTMPKYTDPKTGKTKHLPYTQKGMETAKKMERQGVAVQRKPPPKRK